VIAATVAAIRTIDAKHMEKYDSTFGGQEDHDKCALESCGILLC
jgi:hypothetical protein